MINESTPDWDINQNRELNIFGKIVYSKTIQNFILICIILNSIQLGLDTAVWWKSFAGDASFILDKIFIWIFAIEIALKLLSDKHHFFKRGWNIFDFIIVVISFIPGNGIFSVMRVFRIFRTVRLLYRIPNLRIITESLFVSIPSIGWICLLLSISFYICSVIATNLFGNDFPAWFGTIGKSMYSLFQIMTLESWSMGIVRPVMEKFPYAWLMFVPFIIFATYTVMNLFIGIMVNAISSAQAGTQQQENDTAADISQEILEELHKLRTEVEALKKQSKN